MSKVSESLQRAIDNLPGHCQSGVRDYIVHGQATGGFLRAVFENNLLKSFERADDFNRRAMLQYATMLYAAPLDCYGSPEKVDAWLKKGGLVGKEVKPE